MENNQPSEDDEIKPERSLTSVEFIFNSTQPPNTNNTGLDLKISVSQTSPNIFDSSEQISESDVPQDQRKKNSFYRWFKSKLWCIKGSSSTDSKPKKQSFKLHELTRRRPTRRVSSRPSVTPPRINNEPNDVFSINSDRLMRTPIIVNNSAEETEEVAARKPMMSNRILTPMPGSPPKERQVTFSDTVKTHIKTKYVTAEEYQQIRGLNSNNRRILCQYVHHPEPRRVQISNPYTIITHRVTDPKTRN